MKKSYKKGIFWGVFCLIFCLFCAFFGCFLVKICKKNNISSCSLIVEYQDFKIFGNANYNYFISGESRQKVIFNLFPCAIYSSSNAVEIFNVFCDNRGCEWERFGTNGEFLSIIFPKKVASGKSVNINIEFNCNLQKSNSRLGVTGEVVNLALFYPIPCAFVGGEYLILPYTSFGDPFCFEFCNFSAQITIPSVYVLATGANFKGVKNMGEKSTYFCELKGGKTFAFAISQKFNVLSKKWGNKRVNYYFVDDIFAKESLSTAILALEFYQKNIGEYPFNNFTFISCEYFSGGMEYSAFCVVASDTNKQNFNYALAHEIAHQWFPIAVSTNEFLSGYLDEGLAEFLTSSFLHSQNHSDIKSRANYSILKINALKKAHKRLGKPYSGVMRKNLSEFSSANEYVVTAYDKGFLFFYYMDQQLKGKLFNYLAKFYQNNKFKIANEQDFIYCFKKNRKLVKNLFNNFVFLGGDIPLA